MTIELTDRTKKILRKLPKDVQKKVQKALHLLADNPYHPSLNTKKMVGIDQFEGRIDYHYRFTYIIQDDTIYVLSVGQHDVALGKK